MEDRVLALQIVPRTAGACTAYEEHTMSKKLDHLWLIHTTSNAADAGSDDDFVLWIEDSGDGNGGREWFPLPELPHDERRPGRTDQYRINVAPSNNITKRISVLGPSNFGLGTAGSDAWLPSSMWVIGQAEDGTHQLIVGVPRWPAGYWFSRDASEGKEEYRLSEVSTTL